MHIYTCAYESYDDGTDNYSADDDDYSDDDYGDDNNDYYENAYNILDTTGTKRRCVTA